MTTLAQKFQLTEDQVSALRVEYKNKVLNQPRTWKYISSDDSESLSDFATWAARDVWRGFCRHYFPALEQFEIRIVCSPNPVDYLYVCTKTWEAYSNGRITARDTWLLVVERDATARIRSQVIPDGSSRNFYTDLRRQYYAHVDAQDEMKQDQEATRSQNETWRDDGDCSSAYD